MQAVIMAGGLGTRLRELTGDTIPKPMIKIAGRPLLDWQVRNLKANGFDDIIIVIGYHGDVIKRWFDNSIRYYEEEKPLGTAGALPKMRDMLADEFLLVYGDLFFDVDFERMIKFHNDHLAIGTLFVHPNSHPFDSNLIVFDKNYRIKEITPKGIIRTQWQHNCTNAGIYYFDKSILNYFPLHEKIDLEKDVLPQISALYGYNSPEYVKDIGTVERYYQVEYDIENYIPTYRNLKNKQKAIFLDRDGTINYNVGLIAHPAQFELLPWAGKAIKLINQSEYLAIVVTNQPVVARGLCSIEDINRIHAKMEQLLGTEGAYVNDIFFCPHHPDKGYPEENPLYKINCNCRKPKPGMIYAAAERYNIDLTQSFIIGDTTKDELTGINAGVQPIIIPRDAANILDAVRRIL